LVLKAYTWPRDSHGLFDYESETITKERIVIKDSVRLIRCENSVTAIDYQNNQDPPGLFLSIEKTQTGYRMKSEKTGEMWMVIDCNKTKSVSKGYKLNKGEIIKLGRVKYTVKEVCGYEDDIETKNEAQFIPCISGNDHKICRICLVEEEESDPLIAPCNCGGTMKYIHLSCFKKWIESKTIKKQTENSASYQVKALTCEISRCPIAANIMVQNQNVDLLSIQKVEPPYITLESYNPEKNEYSIHLISLNNKNNVRLGRGHDSDIRISDISVSRCHAIIKYANGEFVLEDNSSKFGTLVEGKEIEISSDRNNACVQVGRTLLVLTYTNQDNEGLDISIDETDEEQE
jgi:hypothetical protein